MAPLTWDKVGERVYETGVDRGVLYLRDGSGAYEDAEAWNGLTTVTESPSGAEANKQYADNTVYVNLTSAEEFGATVEAYTYPEKFSECDGTVIIDGVAIGQQNRRSFGLCYRTRKGNDQDGPGHGYKLHLVYGAQAAPSEKAYATINDSPEAITFSWDLTTTPVDVPGLNPSSILTIDSTKVASGDLQTLENILYGDDAVEARLPLPEEVLGIFGTGAVTMVNMVGPNAPTYNAATHVVTIPNVVGVDWEINGDPVEPGAQTAMAPGDVSIVTATPTAGHALTGDDDWAFDY